MAESETVRDAAAEQGKSQRPGQADGPQRRLVG